MRWPEGPPHLALNPPYLFFLCFCSCAFFGGFKGQVRWPLGPKPSLFIIFLFFVGLCFPVFSFPFFAF